jgi:hypothetical protein
MNLPQPGTRPAPPSLLGSSIVTRLAIATAICGLLWLTVFWALD